MSEPNDIATAAEVLGAMGECDRDRRNGAGTLAGASDADWFWAIGRDTLSVCQVDPVLAVDSGEETVRACLYLRCADGASPELECSAGTPHELHETLPGYRGCCQSRVSPSIAVDVSCGGVFVDDSATMLISVSHAASLACPDYTFDLHY